MPQGASLDHARVPVTSLSIYERCEATTVQNLGGFSCSSTENQSQIGQGSRTEHEGDTSGGPRQSFEMYDVKPMCAGVRYKNVNRGLIYARCDFQDATSCPTLLT